MNVKLIHLLCASLLFFGGCAKKVHLDAPFATFNTPTWVAIEKPEGHFTILARDTAAQEAAMKELCQTHKFVCIRPEVVGKVIELDRRRK
jgi:hypothetical protein